VGTVEMVRPGEIYILSPMTKTGSLHELGGGVWSRPAASFMQLGGGACRLGGRVSVGQKWSKAPRLVVPVVPQLG